MAIICDDINELLGKFLVLLLTPPVLEVLPLDLGPVAVLSLGPVGQEE